MKLFYINIKNISEKSLCLIKKIFLNQTEKQKIHKFKNLKDRTSKICSIFLQKYMYFIKTKIKLNDINIQSNLYGKPYILNNCNYNFNISHDGELVIGVSHIKSVGIDIVHINRKINLKYLKKCFSSKEWNHIMYSKNIKKIFSIYWSLKESYFKCIGKGIYQHNLSDYQFNIENFNNIELFINKKKDNLYFFQIIENIDNYIIAICTNK